MKDYELKFLEDIFKGFKFEERYLLLCAEQANATYSGIRDETIHCFFLNHLYSKDGRGSYLDLTVPKGVAIAAYERAMEKIVSRICTEYEILSLKEIKQGHSIAYYKCLHFTFIAVIRAGKDCDSNYIPLVAAIHAAYKALAKLTGLFHEELNRLIEEQKETEE